MAPPRKAVRLSPIKSIKIAAKGETKNVIPIERDPIKAANILIELKINVI